MRNLFLAFCLCLSVSLFSQTEVFLVDSVYCHEFPGGVETPKDRTYNLDFTPQGDILEAVTQNYDLAAGAYVNARRTLYQRNGNGDPTEQIIQTWSGTTWQNLERKVFLPTDQGFFEEITTQDWQGDAWLNRTFESYDFITGTNRPFRFQILNWDAAQSSFVNQAQFIYIYTGDGRLQETRFQLWNAQQFAWQDANRTQETYNGEGNNVESIVSLPGAAANTWEPSSRKLRTFTAEGLIATEQDDFYDTVNGGWQPQKRVNFIYGNMSLEVSKTEQVYQNNEWVDFFRFLTSYDNDFNQTGFDAEIFSNGAWNAQFGCDLFYRQTTIVANQSPLVELPCTVVNPLRPGQSFDCPELRGTARWFDANGRLLKTETVDGSLQAPEGATGNTVVQLISERGISVVRLLIL